MKTIILGAGVTGLTVGYDTDAQIFEADSEIGGLCKSYAFQGFRYEEAGGHWIFGMTKKVYNLFTKLGVDYITYKKKTGVYLNTIIDGNIQDHVNQDYGVGLGSMKEFFVKRFGKQLCNMFFFPFNERYTAGLYEMVAPECEYKSPQTKDTGYNDTFIYPNKGLGFLINKLADKCNINTGRKVIRIYSDKKVIFFENGGPVEYDKLISTIPLNNLLDTLGIENNLPFVTTYVSNIYGEKGVNYPKHQWLYVPYSRFYRIGFYDNVSPMFAPDSHCMIYTETTDVGCTPELIIEELESHGIIKNAKVASATAIPVAYTYCFPNSNVSKYIKDLKKDDIHSIGRYGKYKFQGIAESITDGLNIRGELC